MKKIIKWCVVLNSVSVHDFEPQILIKGVHLSNFEKVDFFLMKKGIHIMNPKKQKKKDMSPYSFLVYIQYEFM